MNAYYIGFVQGHHLDDIDIGIGSIAYWEYYPIDAVVIANDENEARALFAVNITASKFAANVLGVQQGASFLQVLQAMTESCDGLDYQELQVASILDEDEKVIEPNSGHWLCRVIQHHPDIDSYARYYALKLDRPLWFETQAVRS